MSPLAPSGYDAARSRREDDDLDRWRFAAEIVEVVLATPSDWSVRIGIFGKWGEGKSTVLRFAEQMLNEKQNIVFSFSPWAIQNWNDLWEDFGNRLLEALSAAKIPFDGSWKKSAKDSGKWLESKGLGQIAETAAAFFGREKLYNAAFGVLSRWLKYDGAQIRAIREKLQNRRLVVLIDDLDRCAPELLPQLLLSLRELLDLPGFTFVLAFDDEIVGRALTEKNPAWADGSNFLEKILDFRFHLPAVTEVQKERFISKAIAKYCPFVPMESAKEVQDLLPNNPRKLKALIRSLAALQPQIARHDPDELNWVDMWLAQMLRLESYPFFERLLKGDTLDKEAGTLYQLLTAPSRDKLQDEGREKNQSLKQLIKESGVDNPVVVQRLTQLIEATRSRSSLRFRYVCELAVRPHAVTWKEFRSLYATWAADRRAPILADWIARHAVDRAVSPDDVDEELFEAIVVRRNECLSAAAESASIQEHQSHSGEAGILLEMVEQYLLDLGKLTASRFSKLYGQISYWIGFRKNQHDKALRGQEEKFLLKLLSSAPPALSLELLEVVNPRTWHPDIDEAAIMRQELRDNCAAIAAPKAAREAITFMTRDGGIQSLTERGRFSAVKTCLLRSDSPIWKTPLRDELLELVRTGREDFVVFTNVRTYFMLLIEGIERGIDSIEREEIAGVLADEVFVRCLWETVTSRGIQYRMQITFLRARQSFIRNGVPEALMPLTDDLRSRLREEELKAKSQNSQRAEPLPGQASTAVDPD
jgi:hypothetical protein